ncbi:GTPase HflX [Notoacmeibacter ruber]|uniref:GTPase HflX n=1 Tax=Notoacmeibacter ruber TaxID=2670375 RepID=A0A3L7JH08_9HYPH|nr:GTPase HflX [Notoacmeibacter ruber]RLQ89449.1 GTPase HflX [Notoacmeibacter ruber]
MVNDQSPTRAITITPVLTNPKQRPTEGAETANARQPAARQEETIGLARAIGLDVHQSEIVMVSKPRPGTLLGSGKIEELAANVVEADVEVVVIDHPLTPVQQRNLERELKAKVLDRTGLILEIFGERARTKEGTLQVELAHLEYQRGRLVRSWTHLERQRGGAGFLGGPGETQIEADRRILREKIARLKKELEQVRRTRELHRAKRRKVPYPIVSIVGYTNAGKSTLFNALTGAGVLAEDMLFATLDPTLRRLKLPHGTDAIFSDTVGFISELPTHLVAAFRATLEEVVEADLIIHLRDMSDPDAAAQAEDVDAILSDLGVQTDDPQRVLEVWNKMDLLPDETRRQREEQAESSEIVAISAREGRGIDDLLKAIEKRLAGAVRDVALRLAPDELRHLDWIYSNGEVVRRVDEEDGSVSLDLKMTADAMATLQRRLGRSLV